jgi:hypothetical protein
MSRSVVALVVIAFGGLAFASSPLPFVPQSQSAELVPTTSLVADLPTLAQFTADARLLMDEGLDADAAFARVSESSPLLYDQFLGITDLQIEEACTGPNSYLPAVSIYTGAIANACDPLSAFYDNARAFIPVNGWWYMAGPALHSAVATVVDATLVPLVECGGCSFTGSYSGFVLYNSMGFTVSLSGSSPGGPPSFSLTRAWSVIETADCGSILGACTLFSLVELDADPLVAGVVIESAPADVAAGFALPASGGASEGMVWAGPDAFPVPL